MIVQNVNHPSDLKITQYEHWMSIKQNTWQNGHIGTGSFYTINNMYSYSHHDANPSPSVLGMYVPQLNHLYKTFISARSRNANIIYEQSTVGQLPDKFNTIDATVNTTNKKFGNLQFSVSGNFDYMQVKGVDNADNHWFLYLPDTVKSFTAPKITGIINYTNFNAIYAHIVDYNNLNGYSDYIKTLYGNETLKFDETEFLGKIIYTSTANNKAGRVRFRKERPYIHLKNTIDIKGKKWVRMRLLKAHHKF